MNENKFRIYLSVSDEEEKILKEAVKPYTISQFFKMVLENYFEKEELNNGKKECGNIN